MNAAVLDDLPDEGWAQFAAAGLGSPRDVLGISAAMRIGLIAVFLSMTFVVTGCSAATDANSRSGPPSPRPSASAMSTMSAVQAEAARKALAAYTGFYREYLEATADPSKPPNIAKYAGYPLRTEVGLYLQQMKRQGQVSRGKPKLAPKIKTVSDDVKRVTITDCYGNNGATVIVKATGKDVTAPGQAQRYVSEAQVDVYADGSWLVSKVTPQRSTPC